MPLSGITGRFGTEGLGRRFSLEIADFPLDDQQFCNSALYMATYLHREDMYKGISYSSHLLRTALRLIRDYDVTEPDMIAAMLLHDSVEDHADEIIELSPFEVPDGTLHAMAGFVIARAFTERTSDLVISVTNPPATEVLSIEQFRELYAENVKNKIATSSTTFLLKLSDFTDNGLGFLWTENPATLRKFALKYYPVCDIFITQLDVYRQSGALTEQQSDMALKQLTHGKAKMEKVLGLPTV